MSKNMNREFTENKQMFLKYVQRNNVQRMFKKFTMNRMIIKAFTRIKLTEGKRLIVLAEL